MFENEKYAPRSRGNWHLFDTVSVLRILTLFADILIFFFPTNQSCHPFLTDFWLILLLTQVWHLTHFWLYIVTILWQYIFLTLLGFTYILLTVHWHYFDTILTLVILSTFWQLLSLKIYLSFYKFDFENENTLLKFIQVQLPIIS